MTHVPNSKHKSEYQYRNYLGKGLVRDPLRQRRTKRPHNFGQQNMNANSQMNSHKFGQMQGHSSITGNHAGSAIIADYYKDFPLATSLTDQNESMTQSRHSPRDPLAICEAAYFPLRVRPRKKVNLVKTQLHSNIEQEPKILNADDLALRNVKYYQHDKLQSHIQQNQGSYAYMKQ